MEEKSKGRLKTGFQTTFLFMGLMFGSHGAIFIVD